MNREYVARTGASYAKTPDISNNMRQDVFFRYDVLPDQSDIFRFYFGCNDSNYALVSSYHTFYGEANEPVILVSPEELRLLKGLANTFSKGIKLTDSSEDNGQVEDFLSQYFQVLLAVFESTSDSLGVYSSRFRGYSRLLESLLFLNAQRLKSENQYLVSAVHPIVLMQDYVAVLTEREVDIYLESRKDEADKTDTEKDIEERILSSVCKVKNRHRLQLMRPNQVYELMVEKEDPFYLIAVPFGVKKGNTKIPAIRLYEKIISYQDSHREFFDQLSEIKIACFGKLTDPEFLQDLCRKRGISQEISLTCFEPEKEFGEYLFKTSDGSNELYDLLHEADLEALFRAYHIVLFLDLSCLYRQYQEQKTVEEKSTFINCQWYWSRSEQFRRFKSKAVYYQMIYDCISMWLNSYQKDYTGKYEFSNDLFQAIDMACKDNADVYLYLGYGKQIAGRKLHYFNLCNDEYYDGKQLIVYKFASETIEDADKYYISFFKEENDFLQLNITINLWKIIKSIDNSFYQEVLDLLSQTDPDFGVERIMEISCVLNCSNILNGTELKVSYYLQSCREESSACQEMLEQIMEVILTQAFGLNPLDCISTYFKTLIIHYIVSHSTRIEELIFAYLFSANQFSAVTVCKADWQQKNKEYIDPLDKSSVFKVQNTLYSVIRRLADLRLRNIEDRTEYFVEGFRRSYCPDMSESVFRTMMDNIHQCCEEWGYSDSRLSANSKIE